MPITEEGRLSVTRMTRWRRSVDEEDGWSYLPTDRKWEIEYEDDQALANAVREALR